MFRKREKFVAHYVISGDEEFTITGTMKQVTAWVNDIENKHGIERSVFDQVGRDGFHHKSEAFEQWGTGYWWLTVEPA